MDNVLKVGQRWLISYGSNKKFILEIIELISHAGETAQKCKVVQVFNKPIYSVGFISIWNIVNSDPYFLLEGQEASSS
jgi:hypothetical protein